MRHLVPAQESGRQRRQKSVPLQLFTVHRSLFTLLLGLLVVCLGTSQAYSANYVRYGTNSASFNPADPATYTAITNATWTDVNAAISNAMNSVSRGFIYISGDLTGSGASGGPLRILETGKKGLDFKGSFNSSFTAQNYSSLSVINPMASSGSRTRAIAVKSEDVWIDGFCITGGYTSGGTNEHGVYLSEYGVAGGSRQPGGAAICIEAANPHLSHLLVASNVSERSYAWGGGIFINNTGSSNALFEHITVVSNSMLGSIGGSSTADGGGIGGRGGKLVIANSRIMDNVCRAHTWGATGSGLYIHNTAAGGTLTVFGTLLCRNIGQSYNGAFLSGFAMATEGNTRGIVANCTIADNSGAGICDSWRYSMYALNTVISSNSYIYFSAPNNACRWYFMYNLICDVSQHGGSTTNNFFGDASTDPTSVSKFVDSTNNYQVSNPMFKNAVGGDYSLLESSAGCRKGLALYDPRGFAFVDINNNGAYDINVDVIIDQQQASTYTLTTDLHYPRDMNGEPWLSKQRYTSDADLVGVMNLGAVVTRKKRGTVVTLR